MDYALARDCLRGGSFLFYFFMYMAFWFSALFFILIYLIMFVIDLIDSSVTDYNMIADYC